MLVPRKRLELSRPCGHRYLKPARLPIPPPGQQALHELPDQATGAEKREGRDVALAGDVVNRRTNALAYECVSDSRTTPGSARCVGRGSPRAGDIQEKIGTQRTKTKPRCPDPMIARNRPQ